MGTNRAYMVTTCYVNHWATINYYRFKRNIIDKRQLWIDEIRKSRRETEVCINSESRLII